MIVAGRSLDKARRSAPARTGPDPARRSTAATTSRSRGIARRSSSTRPGRSSRRRSHVPRACIAAGIHYLDLADARDFVGRIGALDAAARAAGVAIISGASSLPALSGAVARRLAAGMETSARSRSRSASRTAAAPAPRRRRRSSPMSAGRSGSGGAGPGRPASAATSCAASGSKPAAPLPLAGRSRRLVRGAGPRPAARSAAGPAGGHLPRRHRLARSKISASPRPPGWCAGA